MDKAYFRHIRLYKFFRWLAAPFFRLIFAYRPLPAAAPKGPYIVLSNHNTDLDPVLAALSFPEHMYFVASEHVYRAGWVSKLLRYMFAPIARQKGSSDALAVIEIVRKLKAGCNVCMFAEGNRSWNGITGDVSPATGKMVRMCGAALVTFRLEGGYLTTPRWSFTQRRGRMRGSVVKVYTPERLRSMRVEEVNAAIRADLYEDAYARQALDPIPFKGRRLAEGIENALFLCPRCGKAGLSSRGNALSCACGLRGAYDVYGMLHGCGFDTVAAWDEWQKEKLGELARTGDISFASPNVSLRRLHSGENTVELDRGALQMDTRRLLCGSTSFALGEISSMAVNGRDMIVFNAGGLQYELRGLRKGALPARRYFMLYQCVKG